MMLSAIKETELAPPLNQQIPVLEKMIQESPIRDASAVTTFATFRSQR